MDNFCAKRRGDFAFFVEKVRFYRVKRVYSRQL